MRTRILVLAALGLAASALVFASATTASAHEHREFHDMELTVGFGSEPAYEGFQNSAEIRVMRNVETAHGEGVPEGEHGHGTQTPVLGLETTLQVEVTHIGTGVSRAFALRTVFGQPGLYRAHMVPTASCQYRFRFFGTIDGETINEAFESGPGRFSDVEPQASIQFPVKVASGRELEGVARSLERQVGSATTGADAAGSRATIALSIAIAGVALGATSVGLALKRRKAA